METVQKLAPLGARITPLKPSLTEVFASGKGEHMVKGKSYKMSESDAKHLVAIEEAFYSQEEAMKWKPDVKKSTKE